MSGTKLFGVVEGRGRRVVLLHPIGLDHICWDGVVARLQDTHEVLRLDLRGHGHSPPPAPDMLLGDYADDVHATLVAFDFRPAAVVGLSFGGMVAQELALRHPEDIDALVLAGCSASPAPATRVVMAERAAEAERNGMQAMIEPTLQRWFTETFRAKGGAEKTRGRLLTTPVDGWATGWRAISKIDTAERLGSIRVSCLCLAGELDAASPPAALERLAEAIPGARVEVIEGAPHIMTAEYPAEVAAAIASFLRLHPAA